jgi:hypothetical protein
MIVKKNPTARPPPYPRDDEGRFKKGKGRVICTHFVKTEAMSKRLWELDVQFTASRLSAPTIHGYHLWAIPYVRLMRKHTWAEWIMLPLATWRANEIAFQMGECASPSYRGKLVRLVGEPLCYCLGRISNIRGRLSSNETASRAA